MSIDERAEEILAQGRLLTAEYDASFKHAPEWYDHRFDWLAGPERWTRMERCIFGAQYIQKGGRVLDLCCGDGFYAGYCFGNRAGLVHGLDNNPEAVAHANELYGYNNVEFFLSDVRTDDFPLSQYDVVTWFDAIEHFTTEEQGQLLEKIVEHLPHVLPRNDRGVLIGSTPMRQERVQSPSHKAEFESLAELRKALEAYFARVTTWSSTWSKNRVQMYFVCEGPR